AAMTNTIVSPVGINASYQLITGTFTPGSSGVYYIGIKGYMNGSPWYISIDDIAVYETPNCVSPTSLLTSNLTSTSVDLAWTENNTATSWKIEYGTSGFTQGTGTIVTTSSNPHSLSGLTAQTTYDWYVRTDCGGGSDTSTWSIVNSFTTACNAYTTPYFEGFETGYTHNTAVAGCLSQESTSGAGMWTANNTFTDRGRLPNTGSWNAFLQYSNEDWIFIPITLTGGISYTADVYARQDGSTTTNSNVGISYGSSNSIAAMTNTIVSPVGINASYQLITGTFTPGSSGVYYIGIKGYMNGSPWYISIDDIAVYESPSCVSPTSLSNSNLTSTSVDLAWTENNSATSWIIEYGTSGFIQGTGTIVSTSSNPHSLSGLTAQTTYDWYVSADCGGGDTSAWSAVNSFTTLCATVTLPYTEGFENAGAIPACWSQGSGNLEDWIFGSGTNAAYGPTSGFGGSGYYAWIDDSSPNNTNTSMETPLIDLGAATNPGLEFYLWSENHGNSVSFLLHVAIDSGNGFNTVQTLDIENTGWEKQRIYLGDYIGKTIQIRFTGEEVGTGYQKDIAIDNVSIADGFVCESPINLRTQFSSDTSTTLRWDEIADAVGYKIRWKQAGAPNFGPVHFRQTNTPIYDIDGLTPSTNYVFVIIANCKAGYGEPSAQRFSTLDAPCAIPTGMNIGGLSHNQARLAWDTMPGAKKYRVRYRVQGTTPWTMDVAYAGRTKLWLTGLNPATTYEWQVKTVCEYGTSSGTRWSGTQTFTTGLTPLRIKFSENKDVNEIELSIYPNPNNGSFNFELNNNGKVNGQIQVYDVVGKLVYQENIQSESGIVIKQIDLNVDAQGIYFLKFSNGDFIQNERIIIQ
ncbi:MAG: T9SS C-terminal target domain-containing protein, partial [Bacteroidetes bacterium]